VTTVVIGTAGHIDHGKTALLRALTGIDADRLPEERRRGMTIDVGYAHGVLPDGREIDFVDVPGHDRLVGNMLVGAGEIDGALLVVAADDGPRAQTVEHLELLDALGLGDTVAVISKADLVPAARVAEVADALSRMLAPTALAGAPICAVSSTSGAGLDELRLELQALLDRIRIPRAEGARLGVDRAFSVRGRGTVVTGTLRGTVAPGDLLRDVPGERTVRVREVQVHGRAVDRSTGGRTALNLAGVGAAALPRGTVLAASPGVRASDRMLVVLRPIRDGAGLPGPGARLRLHLGTESVGATVGRRNREFAELADGRRVVALRLERPIAVSTGDRFTLRQPSPGATAGGGIVLDPAPPRGAARRRVTVPRLAALASHPADDGVVRLDLHGALGARLAPDVAEHLERAAVDAVRRQREAEPATAGLTLASLQAELIRELRRQAAVERTDAARIVASVVDRRVADGALVRSGDRLRLPGDPDGAAAPLAAAMDRLEALLSVAAPPALKTAAQEAGCPSDGIRALEAAGRIVRVEDDLAWSAATHRALTDRALALADDGPLTPATLRDATGTSRRYVLAILEDLDRRGILRRTPAGHVRGPRAPARAGTAG
jgi:selenocysteine-specific elongation factor